MDLSLWYARPLDGAGSWTKLKSLDIYLVTLDQVYPLPYINRRLDPSASFTVFPFPRLATTWIDMFVMSQVS